MINLSKKNILVTGASSGIGRSVACRINTLGAKVFLSGRDESRLEDTVKMLINPDCKVIPGDLTDIAVRKKIIDSIPDLDGIVFASGIMGFKPAQVLSEDFLRQMMEVNFFAPSLFILEALKNKKFLPNSSIVFITSVSGSVVASPANSAYSSSKGALNAFSKSLAIDLARRKIRSNCIAPGMVETEGMKKIEQQLSTEALTKDKNNYPLGRYGTTEDIASACSFLLSDESSWITGTTLIVDGGLTAL